MQLTFNQIIEKLKQLNISVEDFACGYFGGGYKNNWTIDELGPCKKVDSYGGEDQGTDWYVVWNFTDHDVYIRIDAYYTSYEGTDFENSKFLQVYPTEVKKIEYLPIIQ